jgi:hypothetical protein
MKKYFFLGTLAVSLFLTSCTADDMSTDPNVDNVQQLDNAPANLDSLNAPAATSIPPVTKGKDD